MENVESAVPILSPGKHRNARHGGCFMEYASYLAGEPWSDHPACTHPTLASVAREVNDYTSDEARSELAPLIPSVIGLTGDDPRVAPRVAASCVQLALPVASREYQHILAVALLAAEEVLADLEGRPPESMRPASRAVLNDLPAAAHWARSFTSAWPRPARRDYARRTAPRAVSYAVRAVAQACTPDRDGVLRAMLIAAIAECEDQLARPPLTTSATAGRQDQRGAPHALLRRVADLIPHR
jgi:hypothetical protein